MLKFEDVVIPMKNKYIINKSNHIDFESLIGIKTERPFSDPIIEYLQDLSKVLFADPRIKKYPDISTFAFFCRKANLLKLKKDFTHKNEIRLGRGIVFHIAPSNIPVNFAYSLIVGLLSGNTNIIRLPSKKFEQIQIITDAIDQLFELKCHESVSARILLIRYKSSEYSITQEISILCAARMLWGGDETIKNIRKYELSPRSVELTFSDRYSICVIQADNFVREENINTIINGFYNDTYLFDQNACTSPHLVVWLGSKENVEESQKIFWGKLIAKVRENYELQPIQSINKISNFYNQAIEMNDIKFVDSEDNLLWRVQLDNLNCFVENFRCSCGYFSEYHATSLSELSLIINTKYQTLAYYGIPKEELIDFMCLDCPNGIDRIVPIGKTTGFSLNWDGYNLVNSLSRVVDIV